MKRVAVQLGLPCETSRRFHRELLGLFLDIVAAALLRPLTSCARMVSATFVCGAGAQSTPQPGPTLFCCTLPPSLDPSVQCPPVSDCHVCLRSPHQCQCKGVLLLCKHTAIGCAWSTADSIVLFIIHDVLYTQIPWSESLTPEKVHQSIDWMQQRKVRRSGRLGYRQV